MMSRPVEGEGKKEGKGLALSDSRVIERDRIVKERERQVTKMNFRDSDLEYIYCFRIFRKEFQFGS